MLEFGPEHETLEYTPPDTDSTAPKFYLSFGNYPWDNGPPGETDYWNHVAYMGWNYLGGDRVDTSQAGFGITWEAKFWNGTYFGHEFHLQGIDTSGNPHRWLGFNLPVDGGAGSNFTVSTDLVYLRSGAAEDRVTMALEGSTPRVYVDNGVIFQFNTNNLPNIQQLNAARTATIALPFVDNFDRVAVNNTKGFFINAVSNDAEYGAVLPINVATLAAGKSLVYGQQSSQTTGSVNAFDFYNMNATVKVVGGVGNNANGGNAILESRVEVGGNDPLLSVSINGGAGYSIGIDNSDDDKFKISAGTQRLGNGTEDRIVIDANTVAVVNKPFKLPSYTVAGLPSASTAGAGALCYVSDASGGPALACSDGSDWKVVAALGAVVS
jgi:hypothetical protein